MEVLFYGTDFPHEKGVFCVRETFHFYFISCFSTPFLYEANNKFYQGNAGELLIMPPGTAIYHGPQSKDEAFVNDWIYVRGDDFCDLLKKYPLPEQKAFSIGDAQFLKNRIKKVQEELLLKSDGYEEIISCYLTETIIDMYRRFHRYNHAHPDSMYRIETARECFLQNPKQDWTLEKMAALSGYSVSRFSALYFQRFGVSPKADLLTNRIELAKQLILYSGFSIAEISERCGFKSIYYFSKYFKAAVGIPPSEYAKRKIHFD